MNKGDAVRLNEDVLNNDGSSVVVTKGSRGKILAWGTESSKRAEVDFGASIGAKIVLKSKLDRA